MCFLSCSTHDWLLDSGATDHICTDLAMFDTYKPIFDLNAKITIPNGKHIPISHIGSVRLQNNLILHNVLHAPLFHFNLLSVHRLCSDLKCTISFNHNQCFLQGQSMTESPILLGRLQEGLYHATFPACSTALLASTTASIPSAQLWHLRLGHLPFTQIKHLVPDCDVSSCIDSFFCHICPLAKQHRLPFPQSSIKTVKPFQLLHIDIWGPDKVTTHSGCNQFITIVDDFTRATWTHLIKYKSDVVSVIKQFLLYVELHFSTKVLVIRFDNAQELCEGDIKQVYRNNGIVHETSCTNTPQQNGVVERKHRHLLATARSLFFQAKLPLQYWGEALLCATYLINRMPLKPLFNKTPYEKLYNSAPDLSHL